MDYSVVIPAAGSGSRMNLGYNKVFYEFRGKTVLEHTAQCFLNDPQCRQIIVIHSPEEEDMMKKFVKERFSHSNIQLVIGGAQRSDSVYAGLREVRERLVLIHDGARPFITQDKIDALLDTLREYQACILAVPCKDTIKVVKQQIIASTPERTTLWQAQTPQAFHTELILHAHEEARRHQADVTDDASVVEQFTKHDVRIIMGSYENIKITTLGDLRGLDDHQTYQ